MEGRAVTVVVLLTRREIAHTIRQGEGDRMMPVKEKQPQVLAGIAAAFASLL